MSSSLISVTRGVYQEWKQHLESSWPCLEGTRKDFTKEIDSKQRKAKGWEKGFRSVEMANKGKVAETRATELL